MKNRSLEIKTSLQAAFIAVVVSLVFISMSFGAPPVKVPEAVYYIDSIDGDNTNKGTNTGQAWKDLTNINMMSFSPEDSIHLVFVSEFSGLTESDTGSGDEVPDPEPPATETSEETDLEITEDGDIVADGEAPAPEVPAEDDSSSTPEESISNQEIVITAGDGQTIANKFNELIQNAEPGDTFIVPDGEYSDQVFVLSGTGTEEKPITLRAETPGGVTFTGASRFIINNGTYLTITGFEFNQISLSDKNIVKFNASQYCTLSDSSFIQCGNSSKTYLALVQFENDSHFNTITRCYMVGNLAYGIQNRFSTSYPNSTHNSVTDCYFKDIVYSAGAMSAIAIGTDNLHWPINAYMTIEHNVFDNVSGDDEIISSKSSSNVIRYNTFKNCAANLVLRGGSSSTVEGNYFLNVGIRAHGEKHKIINNYIYGATVGIDLWTGTGYGETTDKYQGVKDCLIGYNTIVNTSIMGIYLGRNYGRVDGVYTYDAPPLNCTFQNNILTSNSGELINNKFSENISWDTNIAWPSSSAKTGTGISENILTIIDPKLTENHHGIWFPDMNSPAVGAARPIAGILYDIAGKKRDDTNPDIGSREYVAVYSSDEYSPLLPEEVGPSWMMEGDVNNIVSIESL